MGLFVPKLLKANLSNRFRRSLKEETDPFITLININLVHILTKRATEGMKLQKSITCVAYNQVQTGPTCFRGKKFTSLLGLAVCVCVCVCGGVLEYVTTTYLHCMNIIRGEQPKPNW